MDLTETRRSLHRVAELLLAGPQHATTGTLRLAVVPGGFATVAGPAMRVEGTRLVTGDAVVELAGRSVAEVGVEAGVTPRSLEAVYADGPSRSLTEPLGMEEAAAAELLDALVIGDAALRRLAPAERPTLWPEHFDVAVTEDQVNYGVSPGDDDEPRPYAYVGPWQVPPGDFWDRPFGAARPVTDLGDADRVLAFFEEGRALVRRSGLTEPPDAG